MSAGHQHALLPLPHFLLLSFPSYFRDRQRYLHAGKKTSSRILSPVRPRRRVAWPCLSPRSQTVTPDIDHHPGRLRFFAKKFAIVVAARKPYARRPSSSAGQPLRCASRLNPGCWNQIYRRIDHCSLPSLATWRCALPVEPPLQKVWCCCPSRASQPIPPFFVFVRRVPTFQPEAENQSEAKATREPRESYELYLSFLSLQGANHSALSSTCRSAPG